MCELRMPLHLLFPSPTGGAIGLGLPLDEARVRAAMHHAATQQQEARLIVRQQAIVGYVSNIEDTWSYWYHPEVCANANAH
jgi:hypothetical protein